MDWTALPKWANWIACDESGIWWWYSKRAQVSNKAWTFEPDATLGTGRSYEGCYGAIIPPAYAPKWRGDWRESLTAVPGSVTP